MKYLLFFFVFSAYAEIPKAMDARHQSEKAVFELLTKNHSEDLKLVEKEISKAIERGQKQVKISNNRVKAPEELKTYLDSKGYNVLTDSKSVLIRWD